MKAHEFVKAVNAVRIHLVHAIENTTVDNPDDGLPHAEIALGLLKRSIEAMKAKG